MMSQQPIMMMQSQADGQPMMMIQPQADGQPIMMMQPQADGQPMMMMMQPQANGQPMMMMQPAMMMQQNPGVGTSLDVNNVQVQPNLTQTAIVESDITLHESSDAPKVIMSISEDDRLGNPNPSGVQNDSSDSATIAQLNQIKSFTITGSKGDSNLNLNGIYTITDVSLSASSIDESRVPVYKREVLDDDVQEKKLWFSLEQRLWIIGTLSGDDAESITGNLREKEGVVINAVYDGLDFMNASSKVLIYKYEKPYSQLDMCSGDYKWALDPTFTKDYFLIEPELEVESSTSDCNCCCVIIMIPCILIALPVGIIVCAKQADDLYCSGCLTKFLVKGVEFIPIAGPWVSMALNCCCKALSLSTPQPSPTVVN